MSLFVLTDSMNMLQHLGGHTLLFISDVVDKLLQWLRGSFWSQTLKSGFNCVVRKEGQHHKSFDVAACRMISGVRSLQSQLLHLSPKGLVPVECTAQQLQFWEDFTKCSPHGFLEVNSHLFYSRGRWQDP